MSVTGSATSGSGEAISAASLLGPLDPTVDTVVSEIVSAIDGST